MTRRARLVAGFVLAVLAAVAYPLDPTGVGGLVFTSVAAMFIVVIIVAPLRRGVRPLRIWLVQTLGSVFLLLSLFATALNPSLGPLRYSDITYFSGYACLIVWLALLSRRVGGRADPTTFLDTAAVCSGAALAIWTVAVTPMRGHAAAGHSRVGGLPDGRRPAAGVGRASGLPAGQSGARDDLDHRLPRAAAARRPP